MQRGAAWRGVARCAKVRIQMRTPDEREEETERGREREREESRRTWSDLTRPPGKAGTRLRQNQSSVARNAVSLPRSSTSIRGMNPKTLLPLTSPSRSHHAAPRPSPTAFALHFPSPSPCPAGNSALIEILPKRVLDEFIQIPLRDGSPARAAAILP